MEKTPGSSVFQTKAPHEAALLSSMPDTSFAGITGLGRTQFSTTQCILDIRSPHGQLYGTAITFYAETLPVATIYWNDQATKNLAAHPFDLEHPADSPQTK